MLAANFLISEFLASNDTSIDDEDGDDSDWLEIVNAGDMAGSLNGWYLTDNASNLTKWQFPDVSLDPGERLIVWASDKNRTNPAGELHTNYKLGAGGEYTGLIMPDGVTVAFEYAPAFPVQYTDVSYGLAETAIVTATLVDASTPLQVLVPTNGTLGTTWTQISFSPSGSWINGPGMGVGYDTNPNYLPLINTDIRTAMHNINGTAYIRAPFTHSTATDGSLRLRIKYDDGFVAYLNGQQIVSRNAPGSPTWNSTAPSDRFDSIAVVEEVIDLSNFTNLLVDGTNVFSVHGLNVVATSSDFLIDAVLELTNSAFGAPRYFVEPSPGESNLAASLNSAPFLENVTHGGGAVADNQNIVVTAQVTPQGAAIQGVTLHYRIMFGSESTTTMFDDGLHGDGSAGDGVYGASISSSLSSPGQMVRYYVTATDLNGNDSRFPYFQNPETSQYAGTVVADPSVSSQLPIYEWFVQNPNWFRNGDGTNNYNTTSTSLFYGGEFYDNIIANTKGRTSGQDNAPKFELTFPEDHPFFYDPNQERVKKLDLASIYQDPSASRLTLGFEAFREAGSYGPLAFPVHTRMNGNFYRLSIAVERINKPFLDRYDLDNDGAVYKADGVYVDFDNLEPGADIGTTDGMEKVNREFEESWDDLIALINGVAVSNPNRQNFLFDNVNLPEVMNSLAIYTITKHYDSATHNYYVYRDSDGSGLWSLIPWDIDLIWDRLYEPVFGRTFSGHPFQGSSSFPEWGSDHWNKLIDAIVDSPVTQQMYLRRLRTLMDQILQPTSTPVANRILESRIDALVATLSSEATASIAAFGTETGGSWGSLTSLSQGVSHLKSRLNDRRSYLYGLSIIPSAQPEVTNLYIGDYEQNPSSGIQGEEYIQIVNPNNFAVDISGWSLANAVDHSFVPGTVIPAQGSLYVVRNQNAFRARATGPSGGQGLVIQGNYDGGLSTAGEIIELWNNSGSLINSVQTPAESADFDGDGVISGLDFLAWQRGAGTVAPNGTQNLGDADFDRNVDGNDLAVWEVQYGGVATLQAPLQSLALNSSEVQSAELIDAAMALSTSQETTAINEGPPIVDGGFDAPAVQDEALAATSSSATREANSTSDSTSPDRINSERIAMELVEELLVDSDWAEFFA